MTRGRYMGMGFKDEDNDHAWCTTRKPCNGWGMGTYVLWFFFFWYDYGVFLLHGGGVRYILMRLYYVWIFVDDEDMKEMGIF